MAAFDPDSGFTQVGKTVEAPATLGSTVNAVQFGRSDNHGDDKLNDTYSYFGQVLVNYSNGAFPLLPSGGNDTTPPSAPPIVRDGTGADQSIAVSTTQLSANWDPATDAESGIKGYQYAIGTTPGGTQVADWTAISNVLGVTKSGLELDRRADLLFQRQGRQRRGTGRARPRHPRGRRSGTTPRRPPPRPPCGMEACTERWDKIATKPPRPRSWCATWTRPRIPKAASGATSTPSARRRAATDIEELDVVCRQRLFDVRPRGRPEAEDWGNDIISPSGRSTTPD